MLDGGGDPATLSHCADPTIRRALEVYQAVREKRGKTTLPLFCPCGNDVPVELCHGTNDVAPLLLSLLVYFLAVVVVAAAVVVVDQEMGSQKHCHWVMDVR